MTTCTAIAHGYTILINEWPQTWGEWLEELIPKIGFARRAKLIIHWITVAAGLTAGHVLLPSNGVTRLERALLRIPCVASVVAVVVVVVVVVAVVTVVVLIVRRRWGIVGVVWCRL